MQFDCIETEILVHRSEKIIIAELTTKAQSSELNLAGHFFLEGTIFINVKMISSSASLQI